MAPIAAAWVPGLRSIRTIGIGRVEPGSAILRPSAMTQLPLPFLLLAALLLGACSAAGASVPSPASLDGRTFLSTGIGGAELVPGTQVRLTFTGGDLGAQAGCNIMGGTYAVDGNRLRTTQMFMTEMGCDEPRQAQDEWLAAFLGNVTFTLEGGTLTLSNGTIRLTLMDREVVTPDQSLEGTRWVLDGIVSGDAVSSVPIGVTADTLNFGPIATTKMACEAGPASVETAVLGVLSSTVDYTIDADVLTLDAGGAGLIFRAAP